MTPEIDRTRYVLSEQENERVFRDDIVPEELVGVPRERPVVVFVAGQTGAGKTAVTSLVRDALPDAVNINLDTYKPYHPRYDALLVADDTTVGAYTSIDGHKWMEKAEAYAIENRYHVLMESAMRDPRDFEEPAARFKAAGYRVEAAILAVPDSHSRLGALYRYVDQVREFGQGRLIDEQIHDACYRGVVRASGSIDAGHLADSVFVLRRDAHVVYRNHLGADGGWTREPGTAEAVTAERDRPRTAEETHQFAHNVRDTRRLIADLPAGAQPAANAELDTVRALARPRLDPTVDIERLTKVPEQSVEPAQPTKGEPAAGQQRVGTGAAVAAIGRALAAVDRAEAESREPAAAYDRQPERGIDR